MSVEKHHRVLWRLEEKEPIKQPNIYSNHQLDVAITEEIGGCDRTLRDNKKVMIRMDMIEDTGADTWKINITSKTEFGYGSEEVKANNHVIAI